MSAVGRVRAVIAVSAALLCLPALAPAQERVRTAETRRGPSRVEAAVLGLWTTGGGLGGSTASGIANSVPTGGPSPFFETDARIASAPGGEVRASVRVVGRWFLEGGVAYSRPTLEVRLDRDVEQATPVTASTALTQVIVDGAVVRRLGRSRLTPFVTVGAGYLRQLDDPRTTVGTGQVYYGGGGVLVALRGGAPMSTPRVRLRADLRVTGYQGGLALLEERPVGLVGGVGLAISLW